MNKAEFDEKIREFAELCNQLEKNDEVFAVRSGTVATVTTSNQTTQQTWNLAAARVFVIHKAVSESGLLRQQVIARDVKRLIEIALATAPEDADRHVVLRLRSLHGEISQATTS